MMKVRLLPNFGIKPKAKYGIKCYCFAAMGMLGSMLYTVAALAGDDPNGSPEGSIGEMAGFLTGSFGSFVSLIIAICYVAGIGMTASGVFKFKQHKDNPTQVPLGGPIVMLFIGASLIWIPAIIKATGGTIGASAEDVGGALGSDPFDTEKNDTKISNFS